MNAYRSRIRCTFAVAAVALSLGAASPAVAAEGEDFGIPAGSVVVPDGLLPNEVQDAIVMTLARRHWIIKEKGDNRVVGYLRVRSTEATVTLIYRASKVELYCVGWDIDKKTGERKRPDQPTGWLSNIKTDLTKSLSRVTVNK